MGTKIKLKDIRKSTTDQDRVEMAGFGAYLTSEDTHKDGQFITETNNMIRVNGKLYKVDHIYNNSETGVNYSTWSLTDENGVVVDQTQTTFVVQGSNALPPSKERDALDDANIAAGKEPEQYALTLEAFHQINSEREKAGLPPIKNVVGNSLGGGVAAYIGYNDDTVRALGLNPAAVPLKKGAYYKNANNTILLSAADDVLTGLQDAMDYTKLGRDFKYGGFGWGAEPTLNKPFSDLMKDAITYGHTGYKDGRGNGGYHVDNGALPTSFLTGGLTLSKQGIERWLPRELEIDSTAMKNLVYSLMTKGNEQLSIVEAGLNKVSVLAETEHGQFGKRLSQLQADIHETLGIMSHGATNYGKSLEKYRYFSQLYVPRFSSAIEILYIPLKAAEGVCWLAGHVPYLGVPFELVGKIIDILDKLSSILTRLPIEALEAYSNFDTLSNLIDYETINLFQSLSKENQDGIPIAIRDYVSVVKNYNFPLVKTQYNNFLLTAVGIANTMEAMDTELSSKLTSLDIANIDTTELQKNLDAALDTPQGINAKKILAEKEAQLNQNFETWSANIGHELQKFAYSVCILGKTIVDILDSLRKVVKLTRKFISLVSSVVQTTSDSLVSKAFASLKNCLYGLEKFLKISEESIEELEKGDLTKQMLAIFEGLSEGNTSKKLLESVKPFINLALFDTNNMADLQLAANASLTLSDTLKTEFDYLMNELNVKNSITGIEDLRNESSKMAKNFELLKEHIDVLAW